MPDKTSMMNSISTGRHTGLKNLLKYHHHEKEKKINNDHPRGGAGRG